MYDVSALFTDVFCALPVSGLFFPVFVAALFKFLRLFFSLSVLGLARQLHMLYQYGVELRQQPTTEVAGTKVMEMCTDGLTAVHEAQRLTVPPSYVPLEQPEAGNSGNPRRCGRAGRRRKRRCTTTASNVAESSPMEDANPDVVSPMEDAHPDVVSPMEDAHPDVKHGCGTGTAVMGENLNDEAQFGMGSSQFDHGSGSGSDYFSIQTVIYNAPSLQQFPKNNSSDGFDNDDDRYASPARPEQTVPLYRTPVTVTFESALSVTAVESMNDDPEEKATFFRDLTSSTSLPSVPIPSPQIPISWPEDGSLTLAWVTNLMLAFDWASRNLPPSELPSVLPIEDFDRLVLTASKILHNEPNCMQIDSGSGLGPNSRVVVVGDVHGQLHDVLFLLRDAGFPSEDRFFVFNGDYVDRGAWGLETFLLLLAWKVFMPNRVFLLRGNHESKYCTSIYGFEKEVLTKYADEGKHVYRKCLGCFQELPLASIIGGNVYTAHGGVFRSISAVSFKRAKGKKRRKIVVNPDVNKFSLGSLEELLEARRFVLDPPWEGKNVIPGDVMWSDPSEKHGLSANKERGMGLRWGPDCTEEFLQKFNLKLIIRSHEGPDAREKRPEFEKMDKGYTMDHDVTSGKLITLFSAPDYPQFQATEDRYRNKGAYIVLEPPNFDIPAFHSFEAVTPRPKVNPYYDYEDVIDSDEELDLASMAT
ncbi:hypothetical protein HAX54_011715 [Datura stramonium]|uniref:Serine/threonine-protein phosphatase n=1 Tax=Datura stramonium TaxID=4076 RepID=A0ABS8RX36_DATST|nr:hypothetical protein [Datura stramonium]